MQNREILIRRALVLFRRYGVRKMSVEELTRSLKISRKLLYAQFGDKEGLLSDCLSLNYQEEIHAFEKLKNNDYDAIELFMLAADQVVERELNTNPSFYLDILHYYPDLRDRAIKKKDNFNRVILASMLTAGIRQGLVRPDTNTQLAARSIIFLYEENLRALSPSQSTLEKSKTIREAIRPYLRGLCTPTGVARLEDIIAKLRTTQKTDL